MKLLKIIEKFKDEFMPTKLRRKEWAAGKGPKEIHFRYGHFYEGPPSDMDEVFHLSLHDLSADDWEYVSEKWVSR